MTEKEHDVIDTRKTKVKQALNSQNTVVDKPDIKAKTPTGRPERVPMVSQFKLTIPKGVKEEGFVHRYIRDSAERIEAFEGAWWTPVLDGAGKTIKKASGPGYLLLYRIEEKYYLEDQKEKAKRPINLLVEQAKLKKDKHSNEYVPEGQDSVVTINN